MDLNKYEKKIKVIVSDLTEEELNQYILNLVDNYYKFYFSNDLEAFKKNFKNMEIVIDLVKIDYPDIENYINYCLLCKISKVLEDKLNLDVELTILNDFNIHQAKSKQEVRPFDNLIKAFEESREIYFERKNCLIRVKELEEENRQLKKQLGIDTNEN